MRAAVVYVLLLLAVTAGCGKKDTEAEMRDMQRKADSVNRKNALDEKLRKYDSLAGRLDSVLNKPVK